jgi:hypothetical protein
MTSPRLHRPARPNTFQSHFQDRRRDSRQRNDDSDLAVAPCPKCGYSLIARIGPRGPYFYCLCERKCA